MEQTNTILSENQVWSMQEGVMIDLMPDIFAHDINKYERAHLIAHIIRPKVRAILCTLNNDAYENIVKVVRDKLNLNDLFDNRQKYLN